MRGEATTKWIRQRERTKKKKKKQQQQQQLHLPALTLEETQTVDSGNPRSARSFLESFVRKE